MLGVFNNIWIKLVALAMGLLLWFHVVTEKRYNYQLSLPVKEIALKNDLTLFFCELPKLFTVGQANRFTDCLLVDKLHP